VPKFGRAGGSNFSIVPAPGPLAANLYYVGRPGFDQTLDIRLPYNMFPPLAIIPETFSFRAPKVGFIFEISIFSIFGGSPTHMPASIDKLSTAIYSSAGRLPYLPISALLLLPFRIYWPSNLVSEH